MQKQIKCDNYVYINKTTHAARCRGIPINIFDAFI